MTEARTGTFAELVGDTPYPGIVRRTLQSKRMTLAEYTFEPGATFPLHHHAQQQVTLVAEGDVALTVGDATQTLPAGAWSVVPGGLEHGITAGAGGARIVAIISPRREGAGDITLAS